MRVLLVEDDPAIRDFLLRALSEQGFKVDAAGSAEEAMGQVLEGVHDLLIVDLILTGMDGLRFIARCRERGVQAPVLILSARRTVDERVRGLEAGGDDYLVKPFSLAELLARARALLRRGKPVQAEASVLKVADLELNLLRREATRGGRIIPLTTKEFALLELLCRHAGSAVSRTMILDRVWGVRFDPATNVVDVHIHRLRSKINDGAERKLIRTIRGAGYVIDPD